jgi:hypothetical protein
MLLGQAAGAPSGCCSNIPWLESWEVASAFCKGAASLFKRTELRVASQWQARTHGSLFAGAPDLPLCSHLLDVYSRPCPVVPETDLWTAHAGPAALYTAKGGAAIAVGCARSTSHVSYLNLTCAQLLGSSSIDSATDTSAYVCIQPLKQHCQ